MNKRTQKLILTFLVVFTLIVGGAIIYYRTRDFDSKGYDKYSKSYVEYITFFAKENKDSSKRFARRGILFRKPGAKATVLICHGFMCSKSDIRFIRYLFKEYNVMVF